MEQQPSASQAMSLSGMFARVFWMALGPFLLVGVGVAVARSEQPGLGLEDLAYGVVFAALLAVRVIDFRWLGGQDSDGKPETRQGVKRWIAIAAGVGLSAWGLAHAAAWRFAE